MSRRALIRHIDAEGSGHQHITVDGLEVRNMAGEALGRVEGVLFDQAADEPLQVVVAARRWFHAWHFLVPMSETQLSESHDALIVALTKEQANRLPDFDTTGVHALSELR